MANIKVLIVDDSAIVRDVLSASLAKYDDIEVVGVAPDPFIARDKILQSKPDVVTLDIEMPRMDGISFLERLIAYYPIPVIVVSSVTTSDRHAAIRALEIGAFDVVNKPGGALSVSEVVEEIVGKIRSAYEVRDSFAQRRADFQTKYSALLKASSAPKPTHLGQVKTTDKVVCIGSSTGGTVALEYLFQRLPAHMPPILVVQHMPPNFTLQFAQRLKSLSSLDIREAQDGELITDGSVWIAPGGFHLTLSRRGASLYTRLTTSERVQFQRPSADVLFRSAAEVAGVNVVGVLLTGMGKDGAEGLLSLKNRGAWTIAQDEASSVVWGMPKAAIDLGAASEILSLESIVARLVELASMRS